MASSESDSDQHKQESESGKAKIAENQNVSKISKLSDVHWVNLWVHLCADLAAIMITSPIFVVIVSLK